MIPKDLKNSLTYEKAIVPLAQSDNTAIVSSVIDMQGYHGLNFVILSGSLADADATFTVLVEHDDVVGMGTATAVSDDELIGTEAAASYTFSEDSTLKTIGYAGTKRYVRLTITPANNTGSAIFAAVAVKAPNVMGTA